MSLITLEQYKDYKGITNPSKDNEYTTVIESINALIKSYCNRTFTDFFSNNKVEAFVAKEGQTVITLKEIPIVQLVSVTEDGEDITSEVTWSSDYGFVNYAFTGGKTVEVTYKGGTENTPADIKLAALELTDYYIKDEHKQKRTFGNSTIEYFEVGNEWPLHIQYILNAHRDL